jgi:hypothetical protein
MFSVFLLKICTRVCTSVYCAQASTIQNHIGQRMTESAISFQNVEYGAVSMILSIADNKSNLRFNSRAYII